MLILSAILLFLSPVINTLDPVKAQKLGDPVYVSAAGTITLILLIVLMLFYLGIILANKPGKKFKKPLVYTRVLYAVRDSTYHGSSRRKLPF